MAATVLMTQTLPTIVGAGVISRTTDTMFGKNKQRGKRKMAKGRTAKSRRASAKKAWRTRRKLYGKGGRKRRVVALIN